MIKYARKIRILLLKIEECPDFSILQSNYAYVAPMKELASTLTVWIFLNFCPLIGFLHLSRWIFLGFVHTSGFYLPWGGGVRTLTGTTLSVSLHQYGLSGIIVSEFSNFQIDI